MNALTEDQIRDLKILARFVRLYCHARHDRRSAGEQPVPASLRTGRDADNLLCPECADLLTHGIQKRQLCPLDPKPTCKGCRIHCYSEEYRRKIREIMAYSGRRMILRGRLDYLWHYFIKR